MGPEWRVRRRSGGALGVRQVGARSHRIAKRIARRHPAQSATAQRAAARSGGAAHRRHLRRAIAAFVLARRVPAPHARPLAWAAAILYKAAIPDIRADKSPPRRTLMAVPKRKTSPSRRGMRRSADALKKPSYVEDKDSGELRRPHHIDLKTGMYKGRQVLKPRSEA